MSYEFRFKIAKHRKSVTFRAVFPKTMSNSDVEVYGRSLSLRFVAVRTVAEEIHVADVVKRIFQSLFLDGGFLSAGAGHTKYQ